MRSEIEAKFLNVNFDQLRQKLNDAGAKCVQPMRLLRRVTIETPDLIMKNAYLRVRDEGDKVTMTYKQFDTLSVDGAKEIEVIVSDFEDTIALLSAGGLAYGSMQESRRETWMLDGCEVVLDEWPWLKPYIEIEGESEILIKSAADKLGFDWKDAIFGDVMVAYRAQYPHLTERDTVGRIPSVKFSDPLPDLLIP